MISIVIPLYNKEKQISKTLETVFNQGFKDFEVLIVDDGSTDGSVEVVRQFTDSRIRLIQQKNAGVSSARNRGVAEARGEFVAFLDADDLWHPNYLAMQIELVEKYPECDAFATNYEFADSKGRVTPTILRRLPFDGKDGILANYFEVASLSHPPLWTSAVMVRRSAMEAIGGFPLGIKSGEDLLTWARLACRGKIAYSMRPLATFVFDPENFNEDQRKRAPETKDVVGEELKKLYLQYKMPYQRDYVALWHKMRGRIFLQKGFSGLARKECIKAMRYSSSIKIAVFTVMTLLPTRLVNKIFKRLG